MSYDTVIVDFEAFYVNNIWHIKELAACHNNDSVIQFSFKSVFPHESLSYKDRQTVSEQFKIHNIPWNSGDLCPSDLLMVTRNNLVKENALYFVKGAEKCIIVSNLLNKPVTNIDVMGCPKLEELFNEGKKKDKVKHQTKCLCFPYLHNSQHTWHCASRKVQLVSDWMVDQGQNNDGDILNITKIALSTTQKIAYPGNRNISTSCFFHLF